VHVVRGDLTQPESFEEELVGIETVIHCAALVSFKLTDADALFQCNVLGTRHLLEAALAQGCTNFIYISSISTLVRRVGQLTDETLLPDLEDQRQRDPYGYTKRLGEIEVQSRADKMRCVILNPSVMIGPGDRRVESVLRTWHWLRWLLPGLPIISTQNSFVDVRDVAQAVVLALNRGTSGERYIVTGYNVDMPFFARAALKVIGWQRPVFILPSVAIRLADGILALLTSLRLNPGMRSLAAVNVDKVYSTEKIRHALGWMPAYSLEQSLKDALCKPTTGLSC
jgi:dihydroflavonol-4-reductase